MFKEPAKGTLVTLNIAIGSIILKALQIHYFGQPAFIHFERGIQTRVENMNQVLFPINNNIPSYMIGLLLGHFMVKDLVIRQKLAPFAWFILIQATFITTATVLITLSLPFQLPSSIHSLIDHGYFSFLIDSVDSEAPYALKLWIGSTFQTAVSLCFASFCYLCYNESRNFSVETKSLTLSNHIIRFVVNLLSCKFFIVLGRLSLPMMVSHYLVIEYMVSVMSDPFPIDIREVLLRAPFVFFMSIFLGLIIHITMEAPFKRIIGLLIAEQHDRDVDINNNVIKNGKIE